MTQSPIKFIASTRSISRVKHPALLLLLSAFILTAPALIAQEATGSTEGATEANTGGEDTANPEKNAASSDSTPPVDKKLDPDDPFPTGDGEFRADTAYLVRHDAFRYARQFRQSARQRIVQLNLMVKNYGEELAGASSRFQDIRTTYRAGMRHFYRAEYVQAIRKLENSQKEADNLMKDFASFYKNDASKILDKTSEQMVEAELNMGFQGKMGGSSGDMARHQFKLRMAYGQLKEGEVMEREKQYLRAIEQYRIAKLHAINTMLDMIDNPVRRKELAQKYRTDLLDAYGRLAASQ